MIQYNDVCLFARCINMPVRGHLVKVVCHKPYQGCELTTTVELLCVGLPAASVGRVDQKIGPDLIDQVQGVIRADQYFGQFDCQL